MTVRRADAPESSSTHSWLLGGSQTLHFHSAYFPLIQTVYLSVGVGEKSLFLSIDLRATIIVLWNETATAQFRQEAAHSVFLLFTSCGIFVAVIYVTNDCNNKCFCKNTVPAVVNDVYGISLCLSSEINVWLLKINVCMFDCLKRNNSMINFLTLLFVT